jgi:hypothetical protein
MSPSSNWGRYCCSVMARLRRPPVQPPRCLPPALQPRSPAGPWPHVLAVQRRGSFGGSWPHALADRRPRRAPHARGRPREGTSTSVRRRRVSAAGSTPTVASGLMGTWPVILRPRPSASQSSTVVTRHRCQGRRSSVANMGVHRDQFEQHRPRLRCPPNSAGWSTRLLTTGTSLTSSRAAQLAGLPGDRPAGSRVRR